MEERIQTALEKREVESAAEPTKEGALFVPRVDIMEDREGLTLLMDLPGVSREGVSIELEKGELRVYGKVMEKTFPGDAIWTEYRVGDFSRTFAVAEGIDQSKVEAGLENGVLRLRLPKSEALKPKRIEVKTG